MKPKTKKIVGVSASLLATMAIILGWRFYYHNLRGLGPAIGSVPLDISSVVPPVPGSEDVKKNASSSSQVVKTVGLAEAPMPLRLQPGFSIGILAKDLPGARVIAIDSEGNIWLSQTSQGIVSKLTMKDGRLVKQETVLSDLNNPHGLAFDPKDSNVLFIAEETKISKTVLKSGLPGVLDKIADLPVRGNHYTRTLLFGPEGRLYVSIGSTCNVCHESDPRYASVYSLNKDGSDFRPVAKGLRNSAFMVLNSRDQKIWATEMGRDLIGDDIPPDEINIIDPLARETENFGWPICYGNNVHDTTFDKNTYFRNPCQAPFEKASQIDLQAHSAPLGLSFVPADSAWPQEYQNNILVAFHGSWNRSTPTGYKVVRLILDGEGKLIRQEDFISGWLSSKSALGRPVGLVFDSAGSLYVSDDKAGVIYKVWHE